MNRIAPSAAATLLSIYAVVFLAMNAGLIA